MLLFAFVLFSFQGAKFSCLWRKFRASVDFIRKSTKVHPSRSSFEMDLSPGYEIHQFSLRKLMVGLRGLEPPTSRLSGVRSNHLSYKPIVVSAFGRRFRLPTPFGGDEEDRTPDPLLARQVLSQLSYTPVLTGHQNRNLLFPLFEGTQSFDCTL